MTLYSNGSVESREAHKVVSSGEAHKKLSYKHCLLGGTLGCLRVSALKKPLTAEHAETAQSAAEKTLFV